jgi:hypothetical protein
VQQGATFDVFTTQATAPAPQGGAIANGVWIATGGKVWGSTAAEGTKVGTAGKSTWEITGTTVQAISTGATSGNVTRRTITMTTNGTGYMFVGTCVDPASDAGLGDAETGNYTATATTLTFYPQGGTLEFSFTKQ